MKRLERLICLIIGQKKCVLHNFHIPYTPQILRSIIHSAPVKLFKRKRCSLSGKKKPYGYKVGVSVICNGLEI